MPPAVSLAPRVRALLGAAGLVLCIATAGTGLPVRLVLDDFNRSPVDRLPEGWVYVTGEGEVRPPDHVDDPDRRFRIAADGPNRVLRLTTNARPHRLTRLVNGPRSPRWVLDVTPRLSWRWRARVLPPGAREDRRGLNDTGAAVYVTFGRDRIGRPKQIKYTYSSTLPAGTTLRQGPLRVVVVSSGQSRTGTWVGVSRDVRADYAALFGEPPRDPVGISVWSDSDDTGARADVDIDDLIVGP